MLTLVIFIYLQKGLEELENHMTTGEMLLMKGDTRGQLDQIMNELTKVYHRFKARIHEYHILVKMTIQFFQNLDQVSPFKINFMVYRQLIISFILQTKI